MNSLYARIKRRCNMTYINFKSDCYFSVYYAILRVIHELGGRIHLKKTSVRAGELKKKWIRNYLNNQMSPIIKEFKDRHDSGEYDACAPIWICWWDGEECAPELVKQCIRSIKKNAGEHPVNFIDKNSYKKYLDIPEYMLNRVSTGKMGLAHLSDYIRIALIAQYGGLWLDSTIFCAYELPQEYFELPFFTCKSEPQECGYISKMQWTTFVLEGWQGNIFFLFLKSAMEEYWKNNEVAIDYLFFDYLIEIAKNNNVAIQKYMDDVPTNNLRRDDLQAAMNRCETLDIFKKIVQSDTILYKLSWRENYNMKNQEGKDSIYLSFLKGDYEKLKY